MDEKQPDTCVVDLNEMKISFFNDLIEMYNSDAEEDKILVELYTGINTINTILRFKN